MFAQCQPWPTVLCEPPVTGCPNTHLSALGGNADHVLPAGSPSPGSTPPAAFPAGRYLESQRVNQHHPTDADAGGPVSVRRACPGAPPSVHESRSAPALGTSPADLRVGSSPGKPQRSTCSPVRLTPARATAGTTIASGPQSGKLTSC